jgi:hypothetical protein
MGKPLPLTLLRVINPCHLHDPNGMSLPDDINMTLSLGKGFTLLHSSRLCDLATAVEPSAGVRRCCRRYSHRNTETCTRVRSERFLLPQRNVRHPSAGRCVLICERENKSSFSLELSQIQFINYSLHIVDIFHISCHDISIVMKSLVTRTTHVYSNTMCRAFLLIIACVYRHLTVF